MGFLDDNGLLYLWQKITTKFATKDEIANAGAGDMLKSVYDTDNNGKVDDADKLGGQSPDYYAKASDLENLTPAEHTHEISDINGLEEASNNIISLIGTKADVSALDSAVETMTKIANGKCGCQVFNTTDEMTEWLKNSENVAKLKTGDVFLIRATDVPDYWWDESTSSPQILETTKVDLPIISNAEIDSIVAS